MRSAGLFVAGVLVLGTSAAASEPETTEPGATEPRGVPPPALAPRIRRVILRVDGADWEQTRQALAPRLPGVELMPFEDATFEALGGDSFAYVELVIDAGPETEAELTIVLSDRRAYLRRFAPEPSHPLRSMATTVANTLVAIEQERVEADEREVDVPRPAPPPDPTPPPDQTPPPDPTPPPAPATDSEQPLVLAPPKEPAPPLAPAFELGITLAGQPVLGLAPAVIRSLAAVGGEARLSMRRRRGLLLELGLRVSGRAADPGFRLWRNRLQLSAGYGWRRGPFGLAATAGPTVEPWLVRRDGSTTPAVPVESIRATPLWGAAAALVPAYHRQLSDRLRLRVGLRLEAAVSVLGSGAAGRLLTIDPDAPVPDVLFGVGGFELNPGLELTLWIAPAGPA